MSEASSPCAAPDICGLAPADASGFGQARGAWRDGMAIAAALRRLAEPRRRRGAIRELHRLSDRQLRDVGIARDEIASLVDALLAADKLRRRRDS